MYILDRGEEVMYYISDLSERNIQISILYHQSAPDQHSNLTECIINTPADFLGGDVLTPVVCCGFSYASEYLVGAFMVY